MPCAKSELLRRMGSILPFSQLSRMPERVAMKRTGFCSYLFLRG